MRLHLVAALGLLFSCLGIRAGSAFAQGDAGYSVTRDTAHFQNVFVGHYGEVVRFDDDTTAEAEMQGPIEIVRFHEKRVDRSHLFSAPYLPKKEEYVPENFTPLHLMQLIVIPKNVPGGYKSLKQLRLAKEEELGASGKSFKLYDLGNGTWPQDSFWVSISTPYHLYQEYSQSDKHIFILTTGENRNDPLLTNTANELSLGLQKYLEPFRLKVSEDYLIYKERFIVLPWISVCVIFGLLGLTPNRGTWRKRIRLIGRATAAFSGALPLLGWPVIYIGWRYGLDKWANSGSCLLGFALFMPWFCTGLSARLSGKWSWRVFSWAIAASILPLVFGYVGALNYFQGQDVIEGRGEFMISSWFMITLGIIYGICLGLTHRERTTLPVGAEQ